MKKSNSNKKDYYCDGICETCEMGKHHGDPQKGYDTCDEEKVEGLNIITPISPFLNHWK